MKKQPLVSITIPTYNSEETIKEALFCVMTQSYPNMEIIIIDSYSDDRTVEFAKWFEAKIVMCKGGLLESRIAGVKASKGEYVLLLDSDQMLEFKTIERAVEQMKLYDYLWLYERSHNKDKLLPSLYDADRILTQKYLDEEAILPRFFEKKLLLKAIKNIPKEHVGICGAQDHIVLSYEVEKISKAMGMVDAAVCHKEPDSLIKLFKKQYRWGKTTGEFYKKDVYRELITKKNKFRGFYFRYPILSIKSFVLRALRGIPYFMGFYVGRRK